MTSATERALIDLATLHPIMTSARPLDDRLWAIMAKSTWTQEEAAYVAQREREGQ